MIPGLPRGRLMLAVVLMGSVMVFMAGGVIGGNQAAAGEPLPRDTAELGEPISEVVETDVRAGLGETYSHAVASLYLGIMRPFLTLADWGSVIGYASVMQIGERATQLWMGGVVTGTYLIATVMIVRFAREAAAVIRS